MSRVARCHRAAAARGGSGARAARPGARTASVRACGRVCLSAVLVPGILSSLGVRDARGQEVRSAASADVRLPPAPIRGDDGRVYLLYELHVRGVAGKGALRSIEVIEEGPQGSGILASYSRAALNDRVFGFLIDYDRNFYYDSLGRALSFHLGGGGELMAYLAVDLDSTRAVPRALRHRLIVARGARRDTILAGRTRVRDAPRSVGAPLRGGVWVAAGTLSPRPAPHRLSLVRYRGATSVHDRYAIDFTCEEGASAGGGRTPSANEESCSLDKDVLAVANGVVVDVLDGLPDNDPTRRARAVEITPETLGGNYVIQDIGAGRYAVYAHLLRGSVQVEPGETVPAGTVLGRIGNSGNSNEPHLHFAIVDRPSVIEGEGLPFTFERFTTRGDCAFTAGGRVCEPAPEAHQRDRLPRRGRMVTFPWAGREDPPGGGRPRTAPRDSGTARRQRRRPSHLSTESMKPGQWCALVSRPMIRARRWGNARISHPGVAIRADTRNDPPRCPEK